MELFKQINVKIKGLTPLILCNGRTANPLDPYAKKMKEINSIRKKQERHYQELSDIEWEAYLYWDDELGVYMPSQNLFAMLIKGSKKLKLGPFITAAMVNTPIGCPIITKNGKNLVALQASPENRFQNLVTINRAKIVKTRPIFKNWEMEIPLELDDSMLSVEQLKQIFTLCGKMIGMGDWRPASPQNPGIYGKFIVEEFKET